MKTARKAGALLAVVALAVGGYWLSSQYTRAATPDYITAPVTRGDIEQTVLATGTLKPVRLVAVGAQASGRITAVKVTLGDTVEAGDLIAEIDSVTQTNSLRTAQAALANVKAQRVEKQATLVLNRQSLARQQEMVSKNAASRADFESATAALAVTEAQIEAIDAQIEEAQVAVETAEANLGYTKITAPIEGTVLSIVSQEGQTVNATQSAPTIVILGQLDRMTVRTEISEADVTSRSSVTTRRSPR
jgi:membrane fusion protein, macrolide-specific efflux system